MRVVCTYCLLGLLAVGCAKKSPPPPLATPNPNLPGAGEADPTAGGQAVQGGYVALVYQGRPAPHWEAQLNDRSAAGKLEASQALAQLGKDGYPALRKGLDSSSSETRLVSLQAIPYKTMLENDKDTLPAVGRMLRDPNADVRRAAVVRIVWFGKSAGRYINTLAALRDNDPDPRVRRVADEGVYLLGKAVRGEPDRPPAKQ